jgi:hypothetical protein
MHFPSLRCQHAAIPFNSCKVTYANIGFERIGNEALSPVLLTNKGGSAHTVMPLRFAQEPMDIAEPMPKTNLTLTAVGKAFAVGAAHQAFKNMAAATGDMPLSQCKEKTMPFLLGLTTETQIVKDQLGRKETECSEIERQLTKAKQLIAAFADRQGPMAAHRAVTSVMGA